MAIRNLITKACVLSSLREALANVTRAGEVFANSEGEEHSALKLRCAKNDLSEVVSKLEATLIDDLGGVNG